jgi:hypothetical protein
LSHIFPIILVLFVVQCNKQNFQKVNPGAHDNGLGRFLILAEKAAPKVNSMEIHMSGGFSSGTEAQFFPAFWELGS